MNNFTDHGLYDGSRMLIAHWFFFSGYRPDGGLYRIARDVQSCPARVANEFNLVLIEFGGDREVWGSGQVEWGGGEQCQRRTLRQLDRTKTMPGASIHCSSPTNLLPTCPSSRA